MLTGKTEVLGMKPVPVPLCLRQTSRGQVRDETSSYLTENRVRVHQKDQSVHARVYR